MKTFARPAHGLVDVPGWIWCVSCRALHRTADRQPTFPANCVECRCGGEQHQKVYRLRRQDETP